MSCARQFRSLHRGSAGPGVGKAVALAALYLLAQPADAQEREAGVAKRSLTVVPRVSLSETYTTNASVGGSVPGVGGGGLKQSDFITELAPGIRITSESARLKGFFDYSLRQLVYARDSTRNNRQNALNASGTLEVIENTGFVEASGSITRQTISAFGLQPIDPGTINPNATEVGTYRISPFLRGRLSSLATYELRQSNTWTRADSSLASDSSTSETSVRLGSQSAGRFGWNVDANRLVSDFSLGRRSESERLRGVLSYFYDPELSFRLIGGQESNNFVSTDKESHTSFGGGFTWTPNTRVRVSAEMERRFFGDSRNVSVEYRTQRSGWRFTSTRDISVSPAQTAQGSQGTLYDLFFFQFASLEPDPVRRAQLVSSFLLANGLNPSAPLAVGLLTAGVTLQNRQDLSFTLNGIRDTVTAMVTRNSSRQLQGQPGTNDDFALTNEVRQLGYSLNYARRMSPESTLNVLLSLQRSQGDHGGLESNMRSFSVNWSNRVGLKTTATLGMRRSLSDSGAQSYNETAVMGSVSMQF